MTLLATLRSGVRSVLRSGLNPSDSSNPLAGVTRDATSGIYIPQTASEWAIVLSVAGIASGGPSALWRMQDASGNPADSIGSFALTASGTGLAYQQAVSGWTSKAIATTAAATNLLANTSASLPNISTTSQLLLAYAKVTDTATTRDVMRCGVSPMLIAQTTGASGVPKVTCGGNNVSGASDAGGAVRPWVILINRTATSARLFTDQEKLSPVFGATAAGQEIGFGNLSAGAGTIAYLYAASFFASAAELSDAQVKTLLQTLGWSPAFS